MNNAYRKRARQQSGSTMIEFALVSLLLIPCCFGVVGIGMSLGNAIKISQTVRDTAHMFARGINFDRTDMQDLAVRLAGTLNMTRNGGDGVLIFSKIITPTLADCAAANLATNCPNRDNPVFIHRIVVGASGLRASNFGAPVSSIVSSDGNIAAGNYLTKPSARATGFAAELDRAGIAQERGEIAYVVEGYFALPSLRFVGYAPAGAYCRYIF